MCPYFCKNQPVVMYRKFRNIPIFKRFSSQLSLYFRFQGWQVCSLHRGSESFFNIIGQCPDDIKERTTTISADKVDCVKNLKTIISNIECTNGPVGYLLTHFVSVVFSLVYQLSILLHLYDKIIQTDKIKTCVCCKMSN